jgi:DNA-binding NtrC family response regulator
VSEKVVNILIIDDDVSFSKYLSEIFLLEKYHVEDLTNINEAFVKLSEKIYNLLIIKIDSVKLYTSNILDKIIEKYSNLPVIIISELIESEIIVDAIKRGAYGYFTKPLELNKLLIAVRNAIMLNDFPEKKVVNKIKKNKIQEIVGESSSIKNIKKIIEKVANTDARILITGENGVGKELVARWIHEKSERRNKPIVEVNCAAIPNELIESELFGHEKGSFTSAVRQHIGKFEQADGGTLFLDEIGDMSLSAQAKVLRVLEDGKISRVGADRAISINVRLVTATNKDLLFEIKKNNFRLDLYHRISVILIYVPTLNQRIEDIPLLINHFLKELSEEYSQPMKPIHPEAIHALQDYHWSGNIRELRNIMERLFVLSEKQITLKDVLNFVVPTYHLNGV